MQKRLGKMTNYAQRIKQSSLSEMVCVFGKWINLDLLAQRDSRQRLFFSERTFWLFLSQVLLGNISCRETVQKALAWLCLEEGKIASPNSAAYCKARKRLHLSDLKKIFLNLSNLSKTKTAPELLWQKRVVRIIDGSSVSMPDSKATQDRYPQPKGQKQGCGFPVMRLVVMFSLATGTILKVAYGSLKVAERTLFRSLWQWLEKDDIVLADRGFCSFAELRFLLQQGVDSVMRNHQRRKKSLIVKKTSAPGDLLVEWTKTKICPTWLDKNTWRSIPDHMIVRQITFSIDIKGFRPQKITIVTTLLDPHGFTKEAFIDLYRRRWLAEIFLRDVKISMGMDVLKCKTPEMIHKELYIYLIAYNLIRCLILHAAPYSFSLSLENKFQRNLRHPPTTGSLLQSVYNKKKLFTKTMHTLLKYLALNIVPLRPNRVEPRARKRRPKQYQLLNKPRCVFKEIYHRNRYKKVSRRA